MATSTGPSSDVDIAFIDNYDSFSYNLVQYFQELGAKVTVFRHDAVTVAELAAMNPRRIVISPGPGAPKDAGISCDVIRHFAGKVPVFGVCLGELGAAVSRLASRWMRRCRAQSGARGGGCATPLNRSSYPAQAAIAALALCSNLCGRGLREPLSCLAVRRNYLPPCPGLPHCPALCYHTALPWATTLPCPGLPHCLALCCHTTLGCRPPVHV